MPLLAGLATEAAAQTAVECNSANTDGSYSVPADWAIKPSGVSAGGKFRLMFITSTTRDATATAIATYNTFVQTRAKAGHSAISDTCGDLFKVVGSTAAVDARDNTATATGTGVQIFWLGGTKVADDNAEFYGGNWENPVGRNESGTSVGENTSYWTGSENDGTKAFFVGTMISIALGSTTAVRRGGLRGLGGEVGGGPRTNSESLLALSPVFAVAATTTNRAPAFPSAALTRSIAENSAAGTNIGAVIPIATDADGDNLTYSMGGTDAASFAFDDRTRQISTKAALDFETKARYTVTVTADDDNGGTDTVTVTINVTDVAELPEGGSLELDVPENGLVTVPPGTPGLAGLSLALPTRVVGSTVTIDPVEPPGDDPQGFRLGDTVVDIDGVELDPGETATVCLPTEEDGEVSVRRWDETEKEWVDLEEPPGGSPAGRACGVTTSFSVFAVILRLEAPGLVFSPDRLTVAVGEADGASYTVALSAAPEGSVTVTVGVPAGSDLAVDPSSLTFTEQDYGAKPIRVTASEDAEPGEAVLAHEASGERYLEPWRAELPVTVEKDTGLRAQLREAWLARFGRTAAGHVAEAVEERLSAAAAAEAGLDLPGSDLKTMALSGALEMLNGGAAPDFRQMLAGSSFVLPLASDGQRHWTAWGRGAYTEFDGRDGGLTLDGEVLTGTVGIDREQGRWRLGLALSHSDGDGEAHAADGGRTDLESTLTALHPYARWQGRERLSAWGVLGFGEGKLETREGGEASETDTGMRMAAFGLRGALGSFESARGAFDLAVKSDVLAVRMEADEDAALPEVTADAQRVRLLLEGAGHYALQSGGAVAPVLEAGVRFDDGEAETGLGAELGARLRYVGGGGRMSAELSARGLLAHEAHDYDEWGVGGSLVLHPDAVGRGLALRMASAFGPTVSEAQALWNRHDLAGLASERPTTPVGRLEAELSYGLAGPGGRGSLTPYARHERRGSDSRWRLGARLEVGDELQFHLEGVRGNENALGIHGFVHW